MRTSKCGSVFWYIKEDNMNTGIFGEGFPYSNFHDLNMDWIIKIAKDFLDQYTHIQEVIANGEQSLTDLTTSGLEQLQDKADTLEGLLQDWYDTHSQDIANQLADALNDLNTWYSQHEVLLNSLFETKISNFNSRVEAKTQEMLETIPADYDDLAQKVRIDRDRLNTIQKNLSEIVDAEGTLANGFYVKSDGSYNSSTALQNISLPCNEGDMFIVNSTWGGTANIVNFYSDSPSDETYLGLFEIHTDGQENVTSRDQIIIAPALAKYAVFNNIKPNLFSVDRAIENTLADMDITKESGFYRADTGAFYATGQWQHTIIPVTSGEVYYITCEYGGNGHYALFYNGTPSAETYVGYDGERTSPSDPMAYVRNKQVTIPIGVTYLVVNNYIVDSFQMHVAEAVYFKQKAPIAFIYKNLKLYVSSKYDRNRDIITVLEQKGNNNLFDFHYSMLNTNTDMYPTPSTGGETIFGGQTDMTSPYIVKAVNNGDGDAPDSHWFTGGNHAYNTNNYSGEPNARTGYIQLFADGNNITNGIGYCNHLCVRWTNYVQAYNTEKADGTGREVLIERHTAEFDGVEWKLYGEFIALEDIIVERYYGNMLINIASKYHNVRFIGASNRTKYYIEDASQNANSGDLTCTKLIAWDSDHNMLELMLNGQFDLGKRTNNEEQEKGLFISNGKAYMGLIWGELEVDTGELYAYEGAYKFRYYLEQN